MSSLFGMLSREIVFWSVWILIPILMEILPAIFNFFYLIKKKISVIINSEEINRYPEITLIIPVYNSEVTLRGCLESIANSTYPNDLIEIMLVNNESKDSSFTIFTECQRDFPQLSMQWLNAKQGKSKALNMALFNATGKYIIHIDSDGKLHQDAIMNMVTRFEHNSHIHCMTGTVLTDPELIEETKGFFLKTLRRCEFYEYAQDFLVGRNYESEFDSVFTLSGAFSAFRKSTILKTQLYNTDTVCEDTHVTFQVRKYLNKQVFLCENAFFFVDPIENVDKLYTQRQRWQRGEIEVVHMFLKKELQPSKALLSNFVIRLIMYDHTFAFPRMIWYFALICLVFMNYPMKLVVGSVIVIYVFYIMTAYMYFANICAFLKQYKEIRKYYVSKFYILPLLPLYSFGIFWIRFAGIINGIKSNSAWKTRNLTEENHDFWAVVRKDFAPLIYLVGKIKKIFNYD